MGNIYAKIHNDDDLKELYDEIILLNGSLSKQLENQKKLISHKDKEIRVLKEKIHNKEKDLIRLEEICCDINGANHMLKNKYETLIDELNKLHTSSKQILDGYIEYQF